MAAASLWDELVVAASTGGSSGTVVSICVFTAVLCLCLVAGHLLEENKWVNESITALIIGCIVGALIFLLSKGRNSHILRFDEQLFFIYVLPPIIFNAGFQVKKKQFFHNFLTIMSFGVFGVFISVAIVSAGFYWLLPKVGFGRLDAVDYLALGVIFSSTDTVCTLQVISQDETPRLYSLVFGEGVVNDATSVVLFNAIKNMDITKLKGGAVLKVIGDFLYLFATSTILGATIGLFTAYVLKALYFGRHSTDREVTLMALMAYLSYMLAELLSLSGILTVFFCGIVMSHYAWHNVTESSRITTRHIFATLSFIAETFIFLYVGMDALDIDKWKTTQARAILCYFASFETSVGIFGVIISLILLGRAAFVFPLSILSNFMSGNSEKAPITFKHQVVIWWAGLMRGAVSVALAYNQFTFSGVTQDPVHATIITSTIVVVFFTTLVFGFLTRPMISAMLPQHRHREPTGGRSTGNNSPKDEFILPFLGDEDASGSGSGFVQAKRSISMMLERPIHTVHIYWRKFDDRFMRPIFGGPQSY